MTTKGKVIVGISALAILSGGAYLLYMHYKNKPKPETKPEPKTEGEAPKTEPVTPKTDPVKPVSKYGFTKGDKLFAKNDYLTVYSYPDAIDPTKNLGYVRKIAESKITFDSDANTNGWIKALAQYTLKNTTSQQKVGTVYILANGVTNVAP